MIKNQSPLDKPPLVIMQLTHSGRFSKPDGEFAPIIMYKNPHIEKIYKNEDKAEIITDEKLDSLKSSFVNSALLAKEAGFKSKSTFNKVFKKQTGTTPTRYVIQK